MKNWQTNTHFSRVEKAILFLMRAYIIAMFCTVAFGFTSEHGFPQTTVVFDADTTMTVPQVFSHIRAQTEYRFVYMNDDIRDLPPVHVKKGKTSIVKLLDKALGEYNFTYELKAPNRINISKKTPSSKDKLLQKSPQIQQLRVNGTVTGAPNGAPLPGVNIIVKGTNRGTMSDPDGKYNITVQETDILTFSFIGFKTVEESVDGRSTINIRMKEAVTALGEVEVNAGYYTVKERNRTGSIAKVTAEEIQHQPVTSPLMALQGRVAGLEITPVSGTPGIAPRIRIRGENSLRILSKTIPGVQVEGGQPLYVIDGIPINSTPVNAAVGAVENSVLGGDGLDPLSTINPENIASIEVLKDADATSIYGSRGANGVILITTKQGTGIPGTRTDLDLSMYKGLGKLSNRIELLNTQQYLDMRKEGIANDGREPFLTDYDLTFWDQTRYTDWQKMLLGGTSDITDLQGSISGGNGYTFYRLGGSFHKETMIFPGNFGYKRATGNVSVNHISDDRRLKSSISINYGVEKHNIYNGNLVGYALTLEPNAPELYDEQGELNWETFPSSGRPTWFNPLSDLEKSTTTDNRNLIANGNLSYRVFSNFNAKINLGYTELSAKTIVKRPLSSMRPDRRFNPETGSGTKPSADFINNYRRSVLIEPQLNYQKQFGKHTLDILFGVTYQENRDEMIRIEGEDYVSDAFLGSLRGAGAISIRQESYDEYKYNAIFGRIGYTYKDRYLLNLTGRRDGSSRFGPGNRFGNFGAIGAAWIFSEEPWIKKPIPVLSFGKLRGSYGTTGNDQVGNYQYLDLYRFNRQNYQNATSLSPNALFNPNYNWEKTEKLEAAIEMGFAKNQVFLEVSWFRNQSSNQLVQRALPGTTGFSSVNDNFSEATVENSGWEFLLRGNIFQSNSMQWTTSLNLSVARNKLVSFSGIENSPYATIFKVGKPLSIQRLYTWQGVNPETGEHEFLDVNKDGVINAEDQQFSNALNRDYYGGINNTIRYKGLELSFLFQFSRQNARYLPSRMPGMRSNQPSYVLGRWQQEGDMTDMQRFSGGNLGISYGNFTESDANIEDASFIRLKTLSLAYRFPEKLLGHIGVKQAKLFIQGHNLLTITGYSGLDPETGIAAAPPLRMITSGIQLKF
ncbi:SusC/RagA family TonB-linked outer membrane protein [Sinomicrobium weinanense]|uniref:SusC/RagA family TonB-linked outer membrane protein n=1 Tax=Sinomicrobium weinanense TaxID=2842200 RepID=A0A926JV04_9FLAO|nr:SusC/RagA family TonB-linked outer membrane protein [Sinomicrobium weinanense]MBC9797718.1 SusC/RagA family TonB-linked outer membrane protein [Sinomicrobium weinanense]MBU3122256.1 SusC/RagA family TonB-linked outer membrane protein [Sinomicrobium weinanense]